MKESAVTYLAIASEIDPLPNCKTDIKRGIKQCLEIKGPKFMKQRHMRAGWTLILIFEW